MDRVQKLAEELIALRRLGRATIHAINVDEAVAVSERLRDLGKAQWFRGQIQNWPELTPSLYRCSDAEIEQAINSFQRFGYWVHSTPGLEEIAAKPDTMIAIAQHYGMLTPFIDFTTEPSIAGYFASVSKRPPALGTESCIYCLDIEEADDLWSSMPKRFKKHPERLILDVPNLWRLEAQNGVFVYCPFSDLNGPYPIDRIIFPYQGPISKPSDSEIYPERESVLEALLREYFQSEHINKAMVVINEMFRHTMNVLNMGEGQPFIVEDFKTPPTAHSSWNDAKLKMWLDVGHENWRDVQYAPILNFKINVNGLVTESDMQFEDFVRGLLYEEPALRKSMLVWKVFVEGFNSPTIDRLNSIFQRLRDEMTRLPWTDEEIVCSLSATLKICNYSGLLETCQSGRLHVE
jgi:FRG domain